MMQNVRAENQQKLLAVLFTSLFIIFLFIFLKIIEVTVRKFSADRLADDIITFEIYKQNKIEALPEKLEPIEKDKEKLIDEVLEKVPVIKEAPILDNKEIIEPLLARDEEIIPETMKEDGGDLYDPGLPEIDVGDNGISMGLYGDRGAGSGISITTGQGIKLGKTSGRVHIPTRRLEVVGKSSGDKVITKIKESNKGIDDWIAKKYIPRIKEWIERRQKDIPSKVKMLLDYEQADLTSMDQFDIGGIKYTIFLLYRPGQMELRICLIYNENYVELIDSGISSSKSSNYLKLGRIDWKQDARGVIDSFTGTRLSPANPEAYRFYKVFLSWYDFRIGK